MKQSIAMAALAVSDVTRSLEFYEGVLGWKNIFRNDHVAFFQMNGFMFGLTRKGLLEDEIGREMQLGNAPFSLAHNVESAEEVDSILSDAKAGGARIIKEGVKRDWGGYSGYMEDPDGHIWEVAWNPAWKTSPEGYVTVKE